MSEELLNLLITTYNNNFELGQMVRNYYEFYNGYKYSYSDADIEYLFINDVIKTSKAFKL
jgi:hypothetical protein